MILCAGLTPALQQMMVFDRFQVGEVNRAREVAWCAAGKVLNTAIAARCLGEESMALATLGGAPLAPIDRELREIGVAGRWIVTESATRVCTTILDRGTGGITELVENGRSLLPRELEEFQTAYAEEVARADVAVVAGSLPAGTPVLYYRELVEKTPCPLLLDFRGEGLLATLDLKPYLVKPNREELGHTLGGNIRGDAEVLDAMRELNRRGAQWVVITQGPGPVWATSLSRAYRFEVPRVEEVVNPIGCGDAMTAGIAAATRQGQGIVEAVQRGIAAAAASLPLLFPGRLDRAGVEEHARKIPVLKVHASPL